MSGTYSLFPRLVKHKVVKAQAAVHRRNWRICRQISSISELFGGKELCLGHYDQPDKHLYVRRVPDLRLSEASNRFLWLRGKINTRRCRLALRVSQEFSLPNCNGWL